MKSFDRFISWARYLYWSELNRQRFDQLIKEPDRPSPAEEWKWWASMSQFYSSLWVVIEGWKTLRLKDNDIEYLIAGCPQYCRLLKKFRDSVYHCSPTLLDPRSLEFIKQGEAAVFWAVTIHEEFQRFYWEWPETAMKSPEQINEMRRHLLELVGWLPTDLIQVHRHDLMIICIEAERKMREAGDFSGPHALELLDAVEQAREVIRRSPDKIFLPKFKGQYEKVSK